MDEILTIARDLELELNEDDIEELIMRHENELTIEELQEILNEEHQETRRNVSPSEQEEDERGPMPTSTIKDLLKKAWGHETTSLRVKEDIEDVSNELGTGSNKTSSRFMTTIKCSTKVSDPKVSGSDLWINAPLHRKHSNPFSGSRPGFFLPKTIIWNNGSRCM
ncbi:uncharacterized protein TNCV_3020071 [Trichonephila clavipes]|nr:uncharacterized protein TNCV_3020071 [Trichonephila clavipes]